MPLTAKATWQAKRKSLRRLRKLISAIAGDSVSVPVMGYDYAANREKREEIQANKQPDQYLVRF